MGRKENRKLKKIKGESFKKQNAGEMPLAPFTLDFGESPRF